jgi:hypothetical protein
LPEKWKESIILPIYNKGDETYCSNYRDMPLLPTMYKILSNILLSRLTQLLGMISVDFDATGQLLIFCISKILEKECIEAVCQLCIDLKKAYDSVRRVVLYNILIEFGIPMKLVRLIKLCLNGTYSGVRVGKNLCDIFIVTVHVAVIHF